MKVLSEIKNIELCQLVSSDGAPSVEVAVYTEGGAVYRASVPCYWEAGKSPNQYEELSDRLRDLLIGVDIRKQSEIDSRLRHICDDVKRKELCKCSILRAASMALGRTIAVTKGLKLYQWIEFRFGIGEPLVLPVPAFSMIRGGSGVLNRLAMREFMLLPTGAQSFREAVRIGCDVYVALRSLIKERFRCDATLVTAEGAFAPPIDHAGDALELLVEASKKAGHDNKIRLGIDAEASSFYSEECNYYDVDYKDEEPISRFSAHELCALYESLAHKYPIAVIMNPFASDDWHAFTYMKGRVGREIEIVAGDLVSENRERLTHAVSASAISGLLLRASHFKTINDACSFAVAAKKAGLPLTLTSTPVDTEDSFLADMAVGLMARSIKFGAPCRSEHLAKYNQLLRIERFLEGRALYAGADYKKYHVGVPHP